MLQFILLLPKTVVRSHLANKLEESWYLFQEILYLFGHAAVKNI